MPTTKPLFPPPADLHARDSAEQVQAESRDLLNHPCASSFEFFPVALTVLNSRRQIVMATGPAWICAAQGSGTRFWLKLSAAT